jgi:hypothetical protein
LERGVLARGKYHMMEHAKTYGIIQRALFDFNEMKVSDCHAVAFAVAESTTAIGNTHHLEFFRTTRN